MTLEYEDLTGKIIGAAIEVHKQLGPGFLESIYENALVIALKKSGMQVERQVELLIQYNGVEVGNTGLISRSKTGH